MGRKAGNASLKSMAAAAEEEEEEEEEEQTELKLAISGDRRVTEKIWELEVPYQWEWSMEGMARRKKQ